MATAPMLNSQPGGWIALDLIALIGWTQLQNTHSHTGESSLCRAPYCCDVLSWERGTVQCSTLHESFCSYTLNMHIMYTDTHLDLAHMHIQTDSLEYGEV